MDTLQTPKTPLKIQKIRILGDAGILGGPGGLGSLTPIPGYGGCMYGFPQLCCPWPVHLICPLSGAWVVREPVA